MLNAVKTIKHEIILKVRIIVLGLVLDVLLIVITYLYTFK